MHADDILRMAGNGGQFGNWDRRRVGSQHSGGTAQLIQFLKKVPFLFALLGDGFYNKKTTRHLV